MGRMNIDLAKWQLGAAQGFFRGAGERRSSVEYADNGSPLCAPIANRAAENVVSGDSTLAIGGTGKRHLSRLARNHVADLDGVADGENVRVAGLQVFVDTDAAARAHFQTGI